MLKTEKRVAMLGLAASATSCPRSYATGGSQQTHFNGRPSNILDWRCGP